MHTVEYYSAIKSNKVDIYINLEDLKGIMLSEKYQSQNI